MELTTALSDYRVDMHDLKLIVKKKITEKSLITTFSREPFFLLFFKLFASAFIAFFPLFFIH
jgi:hypothetical protein